MEAFTQWKNAQLHLEKAVQAFFDASISLRAAVSQHFVAPSRHSTFEDLIVKIQSQTALSDSIETQLAASRAVIYSTRNMSPTFVPISILPPELFSRIFIFAIASTSPDISCDEPDPLLAISAVCTRWRQLAIGTRSLWSHIELLGPPTEIDWLWLERSQGSPLHLYIDFGYCNDQDFMTDLCLKLQPHLAYLSSLALRETTKEIFDQFISLCSRCGASGSLKSLVVVSYEGDNERPAHQRWPTTYLQGLVDLQLSSLSPSMSPSFQELSAILSGSPALVTLRLRHMTILPGQALAVALSKLQLLDLYNLDHTSLLVLLSALSPGRAELDFRFSLHRLTNRDVTEVILPFCRRSNIVSLFLSDYDKGFDVRVSSMLQCVPFIRVLFLDNEHDDFHVTNLTNTNSGKTIARCPELHTLCLIVNSSFKKDAGHQVEKIVEVYSLHTIVLVAFDFERRHPVLWDYLTRKVQSVIVDDGMLDGEYEEWDLRFRKLIEASNSPQQERG